MIDLKRETRIIKQSYPFITIIVVVCITKKIINLDISKASLAFFPHSLENFYFSL